MLVAASCQVTDMSMRARSVLGPMARHGGIVCMCLFALSVVCIASLCVYPPNAQ